MKNIQYNKYLIQDTSDYKQFPESSYGISNNTAICISGGGIRSYSAAVGQLRALQQLGLLNKVDYLSTVSGGTWLGALYTYARDKNDPYDFLGTPTTNPHALTLSHLLNSNGKATTPPTMKLGDIAETIIEGNADLNFNNIWIDIINSVYLKDFNLNDPTYNENEGTRHTLFFNTDQRNRFVRDNANLASNPSFTATYPIDMRPFHIANSTLLWNNDELFIHGSAPLFNGAYYFPVQSNALYTGILTAQEMAGDVFERETVGGGFIDTYAFNTTGSQIDVNKSYTLARMIGESSCFYGSSIYLGNTDIHPGIPLIPNENLFHVTQNGTEDEKNYCIADGGNLEDEALIPILQRQVKKIVIFVNSDTPLDPSNLAKNGEKVDGIDYYIPQLFGYKSKFYKSDTDIVHFFDSNGWNKLIDGFTKNNPNANTRPLLYKDTFHVVDNSYLNIKAYDPQILWVYLNKSTQWENLLASSVKLLFQHPDLSSFPHYPTVGPDLNWEEALKILTEQGLGKAIQYVANNIEHLTILQYNMLAEYTYWTVYNNASLFQEMLG